MPPGPSNSRVLSDPEFAVAVLHGPGEDPLVIFDTSGLVVDCTAKATGLLGVNGDGLIGMSAPEPGQPFPIPVTREDIAMTVRTGICHVDGWVRTGDGERHLEGLLWPLGEPHRLVALRLHDTTRHAVLHARSAALRDLNVRLDRVGAADEVERVSEEHMAEVEASARLLDRPNTGRGGADIFPYFHFLLDHGTITMAAARRLRRDEVEAGLKSEALHRLKNILTLVNGVIRPALRDVDPAVASALRERIGALTTAQDILTERGGSATLDTILERGILLQHGKERFVTSGPDVELKWEASMRLQLVFNELGTNALKYGALSRPEGRVFIEWELLETEAGQVVAVDWTESGGPEVDLPGPRGFGTRYMERLLSGVNELTMEYARAGLRVRMRLPMAQYGL